MTTEAHSLVEWINSFDEGACSSLKELSSGAHLFKCMKNVIPTLSAAEGKEWSALFTVLTEFCDCSLEQSVDRVLVEAGDEEHLARVVVLLLCLAVQHKPNEDVISRVTTLPYKAQCDIMYFIEEALAKMKSNALGSGLFTSGVGDSVPTLPERTGSLANEKDTNEVMEQGEGIDPQLNNDGAGCDLNEANSTPQPTPNRLNKPSSRSNLFKCPSSVPRSVSRHSTNRSSYYQGLESPAGVQWMQSQNKTASQQSQPSNASEELLKLQHKVRVLEKSLHNEQTLSQEMHTALCQREQEYRELEANLQKTLVMAEKANELADVRDELQTMTVALEKSQRNVQRYQREVEERHACHDREMEQKMTEISSLETENVHLKELLEKAVADQLEEKSEVKRLQLSSETAAIAFRAKQRECDSLLQLNQELSCEVRDLKQQLAGLQQDLSGLQEDANEKEKVLKDENQALSLKIAQTQEQLTTLCQEYKVLQGECESAKQQVTVAEAGSRAVLDQYQTTVGEMEALRTHCKMVEGRLAEAEVQQESLKTELREKDAELSGLQNELTKVRRAMEEECCEVKQKLDKKEAEFLNLQQISSEQKKNLEEQVLSIRGELAEKEEEFHELQERLSQEVQYLQESLQSLREELTMKNSELSSLTQTAVEQKQNLEELLSDVHQKMNSLTEQYTTEAEEMAAAKASLEEDLSRVHSELGDIRCKLSDKERILVEKEGLMKASWSENEALKSGVHSLREAVEGMEKEKAQIVEERGVFEDKLRDVTALMAVKEQRWLAEKTALENRTVELSSKLETVTESMTQALHAAERKSKCKQVKWREEEESWLVQSALLQEEVVGLTEELETSTAKSQALARRVEALQRGLEMAESTAHTLQTETAAKSSTLEALEHAFSEARAEWEHQREEWERREQVLATSVETLGRALTEAYGEREMAQKEFEQLSQKLDSHTNIEAEYQQKLAEMERGHELYCTELNTLREANSALQQQQAEATTENTSILQRQSELYRELCTLQETKSEVMDLCRQYESAYNEERERRQADREQIRKMRAQSFSESESAATEANSLRKQLSGERRTTTRLGAENRSLKAQVSFLEQKLRDMERERGLSSPLNRRFTFSVPPPPHNSSSTQTYIVKHQPNTAEFDSHLQQEFDTSTTSTLIPMDGGAVEMTFNGSIFPGPQHQSTSIKPPPELVYESATPQSSRLSQAVKMTDEDRISELKDRNRRVLPHLKSSYAVELQEEAKDPCVLNESVARPQRKRPIGNTSVRLTAGSAVEDCLVQVESRKRTTTSRKAAGDISWSGSPATSRRRLSDPSTPQQPLPWLAEDTSMQQDPRRATMATSYSLREYLKYEEDENCPKGRPATMFEMNFSPPRSTARAPPERLKQRLSKREKPNKPVDKLVAEPDKSVTKLDKPATKRDKPASKLEKTAGSMTTSRPVGSKKTTAGLSRKQTSTGSKRTVLKTKN